MATPAPGPQKVRPPAREVIRELYDKQGRYDATRMAAFLDWAKQDIAAYLNKDASNLSRESASLKDQEALGQLAAFIKHALEISDNERDKLRAWLRTPLPALDRKSLKEMIVSGKLEIAANLLDEIESGFAM